MIQEPAVKGKLSVFYLFLPFIFRIICGYVDDPEYLFVLKRLPHSAVKVSPRCGGVIIGAVFCLMDEADRFNMVFPLKEHLIGASYPLQVSLLFLIVLQIPPDLAASSLLKNDLLVFRRFVCLFPDIRRHRHPIPLLRERIYRKADPFRLLSFV